VQLKITMNENKSIKFIDLFAGLGGFHLALNRIGGECVFASEIQPHLVDLYASNFGIKPAGDIRLIDPSSIPSHDLLCAGFPCQPFSKAGDQQGFSCTKQGDLFFNVIEILKIKKPTFFILENVPNLYTHDQGLSYQHIKKLLLELDYEVQEAKLSPHQFGIPQIRERLYIIGSLKGLQTFKWPEKSTVIPDVRNVLDCNPKEAKQLTDNMRNCLNAWDNFLKLSVELDQLPSFPIWTMEFGATYPFEETTPFSEFTDFGAQHMSQYLGSHGLRLDHSLQQLPSHARTQQRKFPKWKIDFIKKNRQFYEANKSWIKPWLPEILPFASSLQKLEWNVKGGERDIWKYVLQIRASGVRVKRTTTAPSLIAMTDTQVPVIGWERRYMTPRECAKLQSLDGIELPASPTKAFHALGNAVNSKVVGAIADKLLLS
jgi:DNA (cytosine-5)-methyltransferase 1